MKNYWKLSVTGGLTAVLLLPSVAFSQTPDQKKTRHIKMTKIENGKRMEIDTVLTGDNVFVWNGDTINPEKHIKRFNPSEFDKMHSPGMDKGQKKVRIIKHRDEAMDDRLIMHGDSGEAYQITTNEGDTTGRKVIIHKRLRNGDKNDRFIYLHSLNGEHFPPVPPVPPVPPMRMFRGNQSGKAINLNDPNVISFKKKDISGGREKIEIIRKKTNESEDMEFNFEMDHAIDVPEPPMPPELDIEIEEDVQGNMLKEESDTDTKAVEKKTEENATKENK